MPTPILQLKTGTSFILKWTNNVLETEGEIAAAITTVDVPTLFDNGNGCWNKEDVYRFKFSVELDTVVPLASNCTITISTLRNPLIQA